MWIDPNKYDYLEADDPSQPRGYLEQAAARMADRITASYLAKAGVSISEWIYILESRIAELEKAIEELQERQN
jgi:hypothetical protein